MNETEAVVAQGQIIGETMEKLGGMVGVQGEIIAQGLKQLSAAVLISAVILAAALIVHGLLTRRTTRD